MNKTNVTILAAGSSSRFGTGEPKCLAQIAGKALLMHSLEALSQVGIESVSIVVGPHAETIRRWAQTVDLPAKLVFIENSQFNLPSIHSFHCASAAMLGGGILVESDLIYSVEIIRSLLQTVEENAVCATSVQNRRPFLVERDDNGRIVNWGYDIISPFELVGIYKLSGRAVSYLLSHSGVEYWDPLLNVPGGMHCCYSNSVWSEVDTLEELDDAKVKWE